MLNGLIFFFVIIKDMKSHDSSCQIQHILEGKLVEAFYAFLATEWAYVYVALA